MEPITLPRQIDDPSTLLVWSADEFVPFMLILLIGVLAGQLLIALVIAIPSLKAYRKFRDNRPDGFALHALYWSGLLPSRARTLPNPFIRRFLP